MTMDENPNAAASTPKTIRRAGRRRATWIVLAALLVVLSLLGAGWLLRAYAAKKNECTCEDRLSFIHENDFREGFPYPPNLSPEEIAEQENQLVRQLDLFLLGKAEIVDQFVTTTQANIAPMAHLWRTQSSHPCWARYDDHAILPAGSGDIRVARSTCGRHDLFAFALRGGDAEHHYNTWGFFRLRLKDAAP